MIPKKIHYCWFGGNPIPKHLQEYIDSWKIYCPDYEIIEWNESNYDVNKIQYIKEAYSEKKYAFVSDYARLDVVYNYGGFYFDTDVEIIKNIDFLIKNKIYFGCEIISDVNTGLGFGSIKGHSFLKENMKVYEQSSFYDLNKTCVEITTDLLLKKGLKDSKEIQVLDDIVIYPPEYFNPINPISNKLKITDNTYTIHRITGSWGTKQKIPDKYKIIARLAIDKILGKGMYRKILRNLKLKK